jgi:hypothetical protein
MNTNESDKLEAAIHRVLRSLPDRKAPAGLEARVLAELSRRAALPWWKKSFAFWPSAVRAGFFAGSAIAAAIVITGLIYAGRSRSAHELASGVSSSIAWIVFARDLMTAANDKVRILVAAIPPYWLYGALATVAACYAALAAIGAATYRALSYARPTR